MLMWHQRAVVQAMLLAQTLPAPRQQQHMPSGVVVQWGRTTAAAEKPLMGAATRAAVLVLLLLIPLLAWQQLQYVDWGRLPRTVGASAPQQAHEQEQGGLCLRQAQTRAELSARCHFHRRARTCVVTRSVRMGLLHKGYDMGTCQFLVLTPLAPQNPTRWWWSRRQWWWWCSLQSRKGSQPRSFCITRRGSGSLCGVQVLLCSCAQRCRQQQY
jgi:hypothetical protein